MMKRNGAKRIRDEVARLVMPHLPIAFKRHVMYLLKHHKVMPRTPIKFVDKVNWRMLHDRSELIALSGDKLRMKDYAREKSPDVKIPETLWSGSSIEPILDRTWNGDWVLKPREGSGYLAFGKGSLRSSGVTSRVVARWRHRDHFAVHGAWSYGEAEPGFFLERRIPTVDGRPPNDLRFYVFHGRVRLIQVDTPRFGRLERRFYTPDWEALNIRQGRAILAAPTSKPARLAKMVGIAESIGSEYDFVRIDLYDVPDGVYFGEITTYPTGGMVEMEPEEYEYKVGSWWSLPATQQS